jgi:D-lactate dehydrogenase
MDSDLMTDDVFFYEAFEEEAAALRRFLPEGIRAGFTPDTIQEYGRPGPGAALISVRTQSQIPGEWAQNLSGILSRSTGYDHLTAYARVNPSDVTLGYLPLYCAQAVAEQALMLWLTLLRRLKRQMRQVERFERDGLTGRECAGRRLLVVGVGNIGHAVALIGSGLRMEVHGVDLVERHADVTYVPLSEGLAWADIVVCAMNLTPENRGLLGYDALHHCGPGALFVNVARGEMSPSAELLRLLEEGHLGGVGLDVYDGEADVAVQLRRDDGQDGGTSTIQRLLARDDAVLTPHNAFNTEESVQRKSEQSMEQVAAFLETGNFKWPVPDHGA